MKIVIDVTEGDYMRMRRLVNAREKFRAEIGEPPYWTVERIAEQGISEHLIHLERMYHRELGLPGKMT